jgi:uncharacterized protein (DUF1697 family)
VAVIISMLRGVNVGGHNKIKMEALRALYESLKLRDAQTYVQSGNVVFRSEEKNVATLCTRIQNGIERSFACRPEVILRTASELRGVIGRNPFARRRGIDPSKLLVTFLANAPGAEARKKALEIRTDPEELRLEGREAYVYFPNGMARPKMRWPLIEKTLRTSGTGRNWKTVTKLLEIAEKMEASE